MNFDLTNQKAVSPPPNLIPRDCQYITPELLPLVTLTQAQLDKLMQSIPGGASNVQDIYPLTSSQEDILHHHTMSEQGTGDIYVVPTMLSVANHAELTRLLDALNKLISRHDVLRTAIFWQDLPDAVQVVLRQSPLEVNEITLDSMSDAEQQMRARMTPDQRWMDLRRAPLLRVEIAADPHSEQYFVVMLNHHIINDNFGLKILVRELSALLALKEPSLSAPVPYREFVAHAQQIANSDEVVRYFQSRLGDVDEPTTPFGLQNVREIENQFKQANAILDPLLQQNIRDECRRIGVTAASLFHLAWALVVARCSNREDVVFGTVLSGRLPGSTGADRTVGLFINILPICLRLTGTVLTALKQTQEELTALLPFEQASLATARSASSVPSNVPLFTSLLNYRYKNISTHDQTEGDNNANKIGLTLIEGYERTHYPFTLNVDDIDHGFGLTVQVQAPIEADRLVTYTQQALREIINALIHDSELEVQHINILPDAERVRQLIEWNRTQSQYPHDCCIHELFEQQVKIRPDAIAVVYKDIQLSYRELNQRANQLARNLIEYGVAPDTLVGLCLDHSVDMVVGMLGILKAGGAYVPLDPDYPEARLQFMLEDAQCTLVITQTSLRHRLPVVGQKLVLCLDDKNLNHRLSYYNNADLTEQEKRNRQLAPSHLAYVIYTSGSTGHPKGVMIPHGGVVRLVINPNYASLNRKTVFLQHSPISFDAATLEIWGSLAVGGKLVCFSGSVLDLKNLEEHIKKYQVNTLWLTSALFDQWCSIKSDTLRYLLVGGDVVKPESVKSWYKNNRHCKLVNGYGPTENTTFTCCYPIPEHASRLNNIPIGRAINDTEVYVLSQNQLLCPIGVPGELYIGGAGLARGYLNRPELTDEKFIVNPFFEAARSRLYRTGDIVRWRTPEESGTEVLEFIGRVDHQVKIRGFRIECGEIEALLHQHEMVENCVVMAREDEGGDKRLVAYIIAKRSTIDGRNAFKTDESDLSLIDVMREYSRECLPNYLVPDAFIVLDRFPLTPNGKLDRKALPEPKAAVGKGDYVAPETALERQLCQIWCEVLNVDRIGVTDNFFNLGGHSLLVIRFLRLAQAKKLFIKTQQIYSHPTIRELAPYCVSNSQIENQQKDRLDQYYPLTMDQAHSLKTSQLRESFFINVPVYFQQNVTKGLLQLSMKRLTEMHDGLRATFIQTNHAWKQSICESAGEALVDELYLNRPFDSPDNIDAIEAAIQEIHKKMSIRFGPLIRATIVNYNDAKQTVILSVSHFVCDGFSLYMLQDDLKKLYAAINSGNRDFHLPSTPPTRVWSKPYNDHVNSQFIKQQVNYWESIPWHTITKLPVDFAIDITSEVNNKGTSENHSIRIDPETSSALYFEITKITGIPVQNIMMYVLTEALCEWARTDAIAFQLFDNGRDYFSEKTGFDFSQIVSALAFRRCIYIQRRNLNSLLDRINLVNDQIESLPCKGFSYFMLRDGCDDRGISLRMNKMPLPEIWYNYHHIMTDDTDLKHKFESDKLIEKTIHSVRNLKTPRNCSLFFNTAFHKDSFEIGIEYSNVLHKRNTIEHILDIIRGKLIQTIKQVKHECIVQKNVDPTQSDVG